VMTSGATLNKRPRFKRAGVEWVESGCCRASREVDKPNS
jgi:hypothetical protein